jgi:dihydroorotate dehydrogenase subfamily 1
MPKRIELPKGRLVIPSGTVASTPDIILRIAESVDDVAVITTKSIGLEERDGYKEPIIAGVSGSMVNAVGLSNPGVASHVEEISSVYPALKRHGKLLMTSIFGATGEEFARLAKAVERHSDWIELNLSCPHAEGLGAAIGTSPEAVKEVVSAVRGATDLPIFAKIVPGLGLSGAIAKIAVEAGADGITAVNTVGPLVFRGRGGRPLLSNVAGGLSGPAIREVAIRCVREVRKAVDVPIIGMGGISTWEDIEAFRSAGATLFGVGTALSGMSTEGIGIYLRSLVSKTPFAMPDVPMEYLRASVREAWGDPSCRVIVLDRSIKATPAQFVSVLLPEGEKPFSLAYDDPITLLVKATGKVSNALAALGEGSELEVRGPYGNGYAPSGKACLVGGGTGVAPLCFIARRHRQSVGGVFIGGRTAKDLPLYDELRSLTSCAAATEDGSAGTCGLVTSIMDLEPHRGCEFFNCGPEAMLIRTAELERKVTDPSKIFCSVERYTKCSMGLCGGCAMDGYRTCIDGPVFAYTALLAGRDFGRCKRAASGRRVSL